jgi:hypothetical protein
MDFRGNVRLWRRMGVPSASSKSAAKHAAPFLLFIFVPVPVPIPQLMPNEWNKSHAIGGAKRINASIEPAD